MGLLPLNHFDDPPQLSLQVVLVALKSIMCLRLSRTQGLSHTSTHKNTCTPQTPGWMVGDSAANSLRNEESLQPNEVLEV